jgi:energy-converting hydrogenase A subunit M
MTKKDINKLFESRKKFIKENHMLRNKLHKALCLMEKYNIPSEEVQEIMNLTEDQCTLEYAEELKRRGEVS